MTKPWKQSPVHWGVAIAVVAGAVAVVSLTHKTTAEIKIVASDAVGHHRGADIDRAHTDLPKRYVTKRELNGSLSKIYRKFDRIEQNQAIMLERLPLRKHFSRDPKWKALIKRSRY